MIAEHLKRSPWETDQMRTVASAPPVASNLPSGLNCQVKHERLCRARFAAVAIRDGQQADQVVLPVVANTSRRTEALW